MHYCISVYLCLPLLPWRRIYLKCTIYEIQLENTLGGSDIYEQRSSDLVIPCISQLAVACQDDSNVKTLNYQVLLKTRHTDAQVNYHLLLLMLGKPKQYLIGFKVKYWPFWRWFLCVDILFMILQNICILVLSYKSIFNNLLH